MRCDKAQDMFSRYLENEMDSAQRSAFEQHLANCPQCEARYDRFNATVMLLEELPEVEAPPAFHGAVMARVEQARRSAPTRVRWWDIDWQRVFTVKVPARSVAVGVAVLLALAILVQLSPINNIAANLIPGQKGDDTRVTRDIEAPQGPLPWGVYRSREVAYALVHSGLAINVAIDSENRQHSTYRLRLEAQTSQPIEYSVFLLRGGVADMHSRSQLQTGTVSTKSDAVVPVVVTPAQEPRALVAEVQWKHGGQDYSGYVFMPSEFNPKGSAAVADLSVENAGIYDVLSAVAARYGVVIVAPGDLGSEPMSLRVKSARPEKVMERAAKDSGLNWKKLDKSIYVVEK